MARIPASIEPLLPVSRARQERRAWIALLAAALALRVLAAVRAPIIESDGAYYAGLARALLAGDLAHAWSTAWPPLYPWATAAVAAALKPLWLDPTPQVLEGCARAVSVVAGVALLFPLRRAYTVSEGITELIAVTDGPDGGRVLVTNGHPMSSTELLSQRYMRAMAHIPLLAIDNPWGVG